ncbi:hypothetical protein BBW65_02150 [Helicobacter enhydrae]|uniref:Autotransporter domain-containing protein n=1 Tax=Helicobacter enhydrae TaxID=222136 RepID=A0A1B1U4K7_9HELI|nr:autotransporter outer membrane beta-barrel domain-containing protein [Helicobacter enhydrae]ANV97679.1 hypothetical protein BBW65_02150 [Helicobacter enhydrae]
MKTLLQSSLLSIVLAQALYGVNATQWWQLDQANNPPPQPPNLPTITDPLVIWEDSTLTLKAIGNNFAAQFPKYNGSIQFDNNLNVIANIKNSIVQETPIYEINTGKKWLGNRSFNITIDSTQSTGDGARGIFKLDRGSSLTSEAKVNITAVENSKIYSVFFNAGTLTFTNDLVIDLSKAIGVFNNRTPQTHGIRDAKMLFDTAGDISVNPLDSSNVLVQLSGDIANFAGTTAINLANANSFFKGDIHAFSDSQTKFKLSNSAHAEIKLTAHNRNKQPTIDFSLSSDSSLKIKTEIKTQQGTTLNFNVNHSTLEADFQYTAQNPVAQGNITLQNQGIWIINGSNTINLLTIDNDKALITTDNLKALQNLSSVDFRYKDGNLRESTTIDTNNRYTLTLNQLNGNNGVFRMFGVFNRKGWTEVINPITNEKEHIATDLIHSQEVFNTHYIQLFWNPKNFDKGLLNKNLEADKIIVAQQYNTNPTPDFVGAVTPVGIYNYITNLKKEQFQYTTQAGGTQKFTGWQWIISDVQRADNSYLSRLLNSLYQTQYRIFRFESDTLNLRLGELREMARVHGVWLRTKYGRLNAKASSERIGAWDEFTNVSLGYDQNFDVLGGRNFVGIALGSTAFRNHGIADGVDESGEAYYASSRTYSIGVYDTFLSNSGVYLDMFLKYYLTNNRLSIRSEVLAGNYPDFFDHNVLFSLETGKKFKLPIRTPDFARSFYYLKPEAQLIVGFSSGTSHTLYDWSNQPIHTQLDFNTPINTRLGLSFGRQFDGNNLKGDVYLGTSFEYEVKSGGDLRLEDFLDKMTLTQGSNFNWRINAGTNLILNEYWRLYFDVDTSFFGHINSTFTINAGVRINFGRLHPQLPYIAPYTPPTYDFYRKDRRTIPEVQNYDTQGILDNYNGSRKRYTLPPKINVDSKPFDDGNTQSLEPIKPSIKPRVQAPQKQPPTFQDNPQEIQIPSTRYQQDTPPDLAPRTPQNSNRSMGEIQNRLQKGFR